MFLFFYLFSFFHFILFPVETFRVREPTTAPSVETKKLSEKMTLEGFPTVSMVTDFLITAVNWFSYTIQLLPKPTIFIMFQFHPKQYGFGLDIDRCND